ncbi:hypothetical protein D5086_014073 [Populus alba]|uniref:Uncharacterized protein n=1 Tax=Populus alba TaxID=43335 RepID=A0ACC4C745_POPAL
MHQRGTRRKLSGKRLVGSTDRDEACVSKTDYCLAATRKVIEKHQNRWKHIHESPVVVALSGSMEPGFKRDMLGTLHRVVESVKLTILFQTENVFFMDIVHEEENNGNVDILTKGDANPLDDRSLYANGQHWLKPQQIIGRAVAFVPYVGWATIIMTEKPIIKEHHATVNGTTSQD